MGVAVLRYRLYDIDRVINRTLVYGVLTVLLAAAYGAATLLIGTAVGSGSAWATAGATLLVAVAFRPLRGRVQDVVDRRFSRARYDARRGSRASSRTCVPAVPRPRRSSRCSARCSRTRSSSCGSSCPRASSMSTRGPAG